MVKKEAPQESEATTNTPNRSHKRQEHIIMNVYCTKHFIGTNQEEPIEYGTKVHHIEKPEFLVLQDLFHC